MNRKLARQLMLVTATIDRGIDYLTESLYVRLFLGADMALMIYFIASTDCLIGGSCLFASKTVAETVLSALFGSSSL